MTVIATQTTFEFELASGAESVELPRGFARPDQVWLLDFKRRRMYLEQIKLEDFSVLGRRYQMSTGEAPTHLRGMPRFFAMRDGVMWVWPVPDRKWEGAAVKEWIKEEQHDQAG